MGCSKWKRHRSIENLRMRWANGYLQSTCSRWAWEAAGAALLSPCSPEPPTGSGQEHGGTGQCTNTDTDDLQSQEKIFAISAALLPLQGRIWNPSLHTSPGQAPRADPRQGKPDQHSHGKMSAGGCWRTGAACPGQPECEPTHSTQHGQAPPSFHTRAQVHINPPGACISRIYLLEFSSFEKRPSNAPQGWDSWLQISAAGMSECKALQLSELHRGITPAEEQHLKPRDSWVTTSVKDKAAELYCQSILPKYICQSILAKQPNEHNQTCENYPWKE